MKLRLYLLDKNTQWEIHKASEVETELIGYDSIYYQIMDIKKYILLVVLQIGNMNYIL